MIPAASVNPHVLTLARELGAEAAARGALAAVLVGSHARGDAGPESDIDLHLIGDGPMYALERHGSYLVSSSWRTAEQHRSAFAEPASVGGAIPAWRTAVIIHDPAGIAAALQREAIAWDWDTIGDERLDAHAAEDVYGYAEEVHKLADALTTGRPGVAAVQRSIIALRLAGPLSVHLRILYDSENRLWDLVNDGMGVDWTRAQSAALGLDGESLEVSCLAAIDLFRLASRRLWPHFSEQQRAVVQHAITLVAGGRDSGTG